MTTRVSPNQRDVKRIIGSRNYEPHPKHYKFKSTCLTSKDLLHQVIYEGHIIWSINLTTSPTMCALMVAQTIYTCNVMYLVAYIIASDALVTTRHARSRWYNYNTIICYYTIMGSYTIIWAKRM